MAGQRRAGLLAEAGDDIQRALGQARGGGDLGEAQRRQAGVLCRLEHRRIAHRQRRGDGAADHLRRVVPGNDVRRDAERLAHQADVVPADEGDHLAMHLVGRGAVVLEVARQHRDVVARGAHRLAGVARLDARQLVGIIEHRLADLHQHAAALGCRHAAPGAAERAARGLHRKIDLVRAAAGDAVEALAVLRRDDREGPFVLRRDPAAANEHLLHVGSPCSCEAAPRRRPSG